VLALRPSFSIDLPLASRTVIDALCERLASGPMSFRRARVPGGGAERGPREHDHLVLTVPTTDRHFWSPWLAIEISPRGEQAHLFARFSPHPSVWTGFAFGYLGLGLIGAVAVVIAASSLLVPNSGQPWALGLAGGTVLAMGGMWWASQIGQRIAHAQMTALRAELDRALDGVTAGS
jgi:hypothetical protein